MIFTRVVIGALLMVVGVAGHEYQASRHQRALHDALVTTRVTSTAIASPTITDVPVTPTDLGVQDAPVVDVYGNEVDEAVGDYRVDGTGDLYESHSPDTEVTRLGPPTT